MLKTLDILIGVATVMLLFSMTVTVITQGIISAIRTRGRNLRDGLAGLLKQIDPDMETKIAKKISTALLTHPLIGGKWGALGTTIHRDELTTLLMEIAAGQTPHALDRDAKAAIVQLLKKNGVDDPAGALKNIRDVALQLEAASPQLANDVRHGMAILQEAKSEYVAKIHGWFDQTIDRVSQRFTATAHVITFIVALMVAFSVQLDTIALVNRLSSDDALREYLVKRADSLAAKASTSQAITPADQQKANNTPGAGPTTSTDQQGRSDGKEKATNNSDPQKEITDELQKNGLIVPQSWKFPLKFQLGWPPVELTIGGRQALGILLSALLLSLGAPFWYSAVQKLLRLRSVVAEKDDKQRDTRQSTQTDDSALSAGDGSVTLATVTGGAAVPASFQGEQGNLQAMG